MALEDTYHRYVVLLAARDWIRILEVNLGATTIQAWTEQPELRERVGREWTKAHYESHRRERTSRFLKEQGWRCVACKATSVGQPVPEICPECGGKSVESIDATAELVRLAGQQDRPIEVVEHCDPLMDLGGVGGLLRY